MVTSLSLSGADFVAQLSIPASSPGSGGSGPAEITPPLYKLPELESTKLKQIVDPFALYKLYELPTKQVPYVPEIVEPLRNIVPIVEPPSTTGLPIIEKHASPWLMRIRHKKMKKHQLKRFRKRMEFVFRRRKMVKAKKREKEMVLMEARWAQLAKDFDANVFVDDNITAAKRGGWGIDILAERRKKNAFVNTDKA